MPKREKLDDAKHARVAPSAFKNYEVCPSFVPSEEATKASERGSYLHEVMEGKKKRDEVWDEQDEEHLALIENYVRPHERRAKSERLKVLREHRFDLTKLGIEGCDRGTGDMIILDQKGKHAELFDWKFGWWEVDDAEVNIQVGIYVLGVFFEFPWVVAVDVHILQPARDEVSTYQFLRARDIEPILLRARTIADRVNQLESKEFNPTVNGCLWCDRKSSCRALHQLVLKAGVQAGLQLPLANLNPAEFNEIQHAGDVYDSASILEKWASAIKYSITNLAREGAEIPNHTLREVNGKRIIVDVEGTFEVLRDKFQVTLSEFLATADPSVTKLMDTVAKKAPRGKQGTQSKLASAALLEAGVLSSTKGSAYLVRDKEKKNVVQEVQT